ncbi:hypothetical protein HPP92_010333 [Vanilla planifolia]|uniref:Protein kinase domain-containing protein n=1 Tax=Vanilla planifolia TaxID=51239 RepID=A0A835R0L9_VANPL|nr:hypothetical protein HPP92_010333 [Vanilla planifolia]
MAYMHGLGFIHRDLKSDNLLICGDRSIKIADFGVARIEVQPEGMTPETGTYRWMAPEMIQHRPYTQKAAFAVVNKAARPIIPIDCPASLAAIMTKCWDANPVVRPSFDNVVRMLENAQTELCASIRRARFRWCISQPMTTE